MPRKSASKPSADAIALLTQDHKKVLRLFDEFEALCQDKENSDDIDAKQTLAEKICAELSIHAQIEEEIFYPALRAAMEDTDLLDEAEVEHTVASQLIMELESMQPDDELYDAKLTVLGEYVRHHVEEEQNELFKQAKKTNVSMESLGDELRQRQEQLRSEFGMPEDEETAFLGEVKRKSGRSRSQSRA